MSQSTRFLLLFTAYGLIGFFIYLLPIVDEKVVLPFIRLIATASGMLIDGFGGTVEVIRDSLRSPINGFAVKVDNGCSGLEAVILICAAVLAFPTTWKMRLIGVLGCSAAIISVNLVRIISLFYIGQYSMEWFEWAHLYAWDIVIMVDGVIAILLWIRYAISRTPQPA